MILEVLFIQEELTMSKVAHAFSDTPRVIGTWVIVEVGEPKQALFSTMAGNKFYPIFKGNGEWHSRLDFNTQMEAEKKIDIMYECGELLTQDLTTMYLEETETRSYTVYEPHTSTINLERKRVAKVMDKFEAYLANNTSRSANALFKLRNKSAMTYNDPDVQLMFEQFLTFDKLMTGK